MNKLAIDVANRISSKLKQRPAINPALAGAGASLATLGSMHAAPSVAESLGNLASSVELKPHTDNLLQNIAGLANKTLDHANSLKSEHFLSNLANPIGGLTGELGKDKVLEAVRSQDIFESLSNLAKEIIGHPGIGRDAYTWLQL